MSATSSANFSSGFKYPKVRRGRPLRLRWIRSRSFLECTAEFRRQNPGTEFSILDQDLVGDLLWTRLEAHRADGAVAHGMNESRFVGDLIAEEWAIWSDWRFD